MKNQTMISALTLAVALSAFSFAQADNATPKPTDIPATRLTRHEIVEKLQLTDAQKKQIRSVRWTARSS
jgi:Spy/CpxP family protein refolding chaperone